MPGKVLIIEDIVTNRIVLNVKLSAAGYAVAQAPDLAEGLSRIAAEAPEFILLACRMPEAESTAMISELTVACDAELIVLTPEATLEARLAYLEAGAAEVVNTPANVPALLARFRALKRARDSAADAHLELQLSHALGLSEAKSGFTRAPSVLIVTRSPQRAEARANALGAAARCRAADLTKPEFLSGPAFSRTPPDVVLVEYDAHDISLGEFNLLSELKSSAAMRHSALLVLMPEEPGLAHAEAFDRGADDVLAADCAPQELRLRLRRIAARKQQLDTRRASMEAGLNAAITDPLTGLFNRRFAVPELDRLIRQSRGACAVLALDIDHFKSVNDRYGHGAGDSVLSELALLLRASLRTGDLAARLGGEEFLLALPNTAPDRAKRIAQRLRAMIEAHEFAVERSATPLKVTVSIGLAMSCGTQKDAHALLDEADAALYGSKRHGRNQVTVSARSAA